MNPHEAKVTAYEIVCAGLEAQGWKRSMDEYNDCAMRGQGGRACAVGHLIDAHPEDPDLNDYTNLDAILEDDVYDLREPLRSWYAGASKWQKADFRDYVYKLQQAHDGSRGYDLQERIVALDPREQ